MLNLRGADAVRQCTKCAVGGGMRVAADNGHARQGCALLRADNVNDALTHVIHLEFEDAEVVTVLIQGFHLNARHFIRDGFQTALALCLGSRHVVIRGRDIGVDAPRFAASQSQPFKRLWRGHFVENVTIDIDQRGTIIPLFDEMVVPQLVVKRFRRHGLLLGIRLWPPSPATAGHATALSLGTE